MRARATAGKTYQPSPRQESERHGHATPDLIVPLATCTPDRDAAAGRGVYRDSVTVRYTLVTDRPNLGFRSILDVPKAHRIRCRAEVEGAAKEDAVNRSDDRSPIGGDGRQSQQAHTGQAVGDLVGAQPPLRGDDPEEVRPSGGVAAVEKILQGGQVGRRLVHISIEPASRQRGVTPGVMIPRHHGPNVTFSDVSERTVALCVVAVAGNFSLVVAGHGNYEMDPPTSLWGRSGGAEAAPTRH